MPFRNNSLLRAVYELFYTRALDAPATLDAIEKALGSTPFADRPRAAIRAAANLLVRRKYLTKDADGYAIGDRRMSSRGHPRRRANDTHHTSVVVSFGGSKHELSPQDARQVYQDLQALFNQS